MDSVADLTFGNGLATADYVTVAGILSDELCLLLSGEINEVRSALAGLDEVGLEFMGVKLDKEKNAQIMGEEAIISTPDSRVTVCVIPTDEELMIATDTFNIVSK